MGGGFECWGAQLTIWQIDVDTGGASRLAIPGSDSRAGVLDFASDPFRNPSVVWSLHNTNQNGYELLSFNTRQQQLLSNVPLDDSLAIRGLAIDPTTGLFYGTSETALYQIDPATGQTEMIGEASLQVDRALGFDLEGNLFSVGVAGGKRDWALISINKSTGETTVVSEIDAIPGDIAVRPEDGVMFGLGFGTDPAHDYSLYQINLTNAAVTDIGPSVGRPGGLAFTVNAMLPCDFDGDDMCHLSDIDRMVSDIETEINDPALDLTGDGTVDRDDLDEWRSQAGHENGFAEPYLGADVNLDGFVNVVDLNVMGLNWLQSGKTWSDGNVVVQCGNFGQVNSCDLMMLGLNWQKSIRPAAATVPEPTGLLLAFGIGAYLAYAWRTTPRTSRQHSVAAEPSLRSGRSTLDQAENSLIQ